MDEHHSGFSPIYTPTTPPPPAYGPYGTDDSGDWCRRVLKAHDLNADVTRALLTEHTKVGAKELIIARMESEVARTHQELEQVKWWCNEEHHQKGLAKEEASRWKKIAEEREKERKIMEDKLQEAITKHTMIHEKLTEVEAEKSRLARKLQRQYSLQRGTKVHIRDLERQLDVRDQQLEAAEGRWRGPIEIGSSTSDD